MQNSSAVAPLLLALIAPAYFSIALIGQQAKTPLQKPLFSEDFESGAIDPAIWSQQIAGDAILKVESDKTAHGRYALEVSSPNPANKTMAFIMARNIPTALSHHLFGRAYMYITGVPDRHTVFLTAGTQGFPKYRYQEVASAHSVFQLTFVNSSDSGQGGEDYHAGPPVPLNRWFLLEWEFNDKPDQATIWVDGTQVFSTHFARPKPRSLVSTSPAFASTAGAPGPRPSSQPPVTPNSEPLAQASDLVGGFTNVAFGFRLWGAAPVPFDFFYDDIALDTNRIGPIH